MDTYISLIQTANRLTNRDSISRAIAGNYYEIVRKYCRQNPETTQELAALLPKGYQLITGS